MPEKRARKIIQISSFQFLNREYGHTFTTALCDDNTVWELDTGTTELDTGTTEWVKLPDIPQN